MMGRYSKSYLRKIRNDIKIREVIDVICKIDYTTALDGLFRFTCPRCHRYNTAVNDKINLARCFDCKENFNSIDFIIITKKCTFLEAIEILEVYL